MPDKILTTGDRLFDLELDEILRRISALERKAAGSASTSASSSSAPLYVPHAGNSVTEISDTPAAGGSPDFSPVDHVHKGVHKVTRDSAAYGDLVVAGAGSKQSSNTFTFPVACLLTLCSAFTPAGTGADIAEIVVPYNPKDGTTSVTWTVRRIDFRVNVAGGAPAITVEKYTGTGAFSATTVGTVTLGSGAYEGETHSGLGTVASGNKLRFNVGTLATATGWTIEVLLEEA